MSLCVYVFSRIFFPFQHANLFNCYEKCEIISLRHGINSRQFISVIFPLSNKCRVPLQDTSQMLPLYKQINHHCTTIKTAAVIPVTFPVLLNGMRLCCGKENMIMYLHPLQLARFFELEFQMTVVCCCERLYTRFARAYFLFFSASDFCVE